ncbi:ATP-binding protein [Sphingomonas fennica]|uniref:histidine kinase n=1 Tax=Edaphosphingomonas fennica TaxID=114404 RepID=A0A2T4HZY9_9SPHN|nr:ATP-binding protein [Sphingomonas fennica]PTD22066.1 histidine kinase [Sphingomonas fennica]
MTATGARRLLSRIIPQDRTLAFKLTAVLTLAGIAGFLGIWGLLYAVVIPSFDRLETDAVRGHIERTRAALEEHAAKMEYAARDYGVWDESYGYLRHGDRAFERRVLSLLALSNLDMNGMALVHRDGTVAAARYIDPKAQADDHERGGDFVALARSQAVRARIGREPSAHFYARLGDRVAAIGLSRVTLSDGSGESPGYVVVAREMTSAQLGRLLQLEARFGLGRAHEPTGVRRRDRTLDIAVDIDGPNRIHVANATFVVPRDFTLLGHRLLAMMFVGTVAVLALVLMVLRLLIGREVIAPLARIERHMQAVSASGAPLPLAIGDRGDEIGSLARSLDAMLAQLGRLRERVEAQSFRLGRSESAIGVMHNVRNGLNPISVIVAQGLAAEPVAADADVRRALDELARADVPAARRRKLAAFLGSAHDSYLAQFERQRADLAAADESLSHLIEIIGGQQAEAHGGLEIEPCDIVALVRRNAAIVHYAAGGPIAFQCPDAACPVLASPLLLSQVIGNLLANAIEAIEARGAGGGPGRIAVTIERIAGAEGDRIALGITDNGEGFDPARGERLFHRGFSTRAHKSGGLGLHWCANAVNAMQGSLTLESDGPGRGATAVIRLRGARQGSASLNPPERSAG